MSSRPLDYYFFNIHQNYFINKLKQKAYKINTRTCFIKFKNVKMFLVYRD